MKYIVFMDSDIEGVTMSRIEAEDENKAQGYCMDQYCCDFAVPVELDSIKEILSKKGWEIVK